MIETEFKVGDYVVSRCSGVGVVISVDDDPDVPYPIRVKWTGDIPRLLDRTDVFTMDGCYTVSGIDPDRDIYCVPYEEEGEEMSEKVECTAINPAHYRVKCIPEAIEIMEHLMTKEQLEGFLWGNIIKYAYRYGRKGDKAETAGKIEWYANRLKEVCAEEKKEQERE